MAKSYVKFETPSDVQQKALSVVEAAHACGGLRKGTNETTKAIERGTAKLVVVAGDVDPEEIVMHIPMICGEHKIAYLFVSEKLALGKAAGLGVGTSAVAVLKAEKAEAILKEVVDRALSLMPKAPEAVKEERKPAEPKAPKAPKAPEAAKEEKKHAEPKSPEAVKEEKKPAEPKAPEAARAEKNPAEAKAETA